MIVDEALEKRNQRLQKMYAGKNYIHKNKEQAHSYRETSLEIS